LFDGHPFMKEKYLMDPTMTKQVQILRPKAIQISWMKLNAS